MLYNHLKNKTKNKDIHFVSEMTSAVNELDWLEALKIMLHTKNMHQSICYRKRTMNGFDCQILNYVVPFKDQQ